MADPIFKIEIERCETGCFFTIKRGDEAVCTSRRDYANVRAVKLALVEIIMALRDDDFESFNLT